MIVYISEIGIPSSICSDDLISSEGRDRNHQRMHGAMKPQHLALEKVDPLHQASTFTVLVLRKHVELDLADVIVQSVEDRLIGVDDVIDDCVQYLNAVVESPPPPCMNYKDASVAEHPLRSGPVKSHMAVDVIRSRRAALYYAPDIPIFTPMGDIEPIVPGELPDLIYVSKPAPKNLDELLALLPFHGAGWYCRPAIEYRLHTNKLGWSDLQLGYPCKLPLSWRPVVRRTRWHGGSLG